MLDLEANIIPFQSIGNINLDDTIEKLLPILKNDDVKVSMIFKFIIRYEIDNKIDIWFNVTNGRCCKIVAREGYGGKVINSNIKIGSSIEDLISSPYNFIYDDFEEVYVSQKGLYVELNPNTNRVMYISIYAKYLEDETECFLE